MAEAHDGDRIVPSDFWQMREAVRQIERRLTEGERRAERIEQKLEQFASLTIQLTNLSATVTALAQKFDDAMDTSSTARRSDWGLAVQITSFGVMAIIAVASLIIALLKSGVH